MKILVLNFGSSSQKCCLYEIRETPPVEPPEPIWQAKAEWNGPTAEIEVQSAGGAPRKKIANIASHQMAVEPLLDTLWSGDTRAISSASEIDVVGHRVVTAGQAYRQPALVTPDVKTAIARMSLFAPLHNRAELEGIEMIEKRFGTVAQVAAFDTGFHAAMPESASTYGGPYEWVAEGIRRYGFHGINHQYVAGRAAQLLARDDRSLRLVTCHLGNGCSLAAVQAGRSMDTTMGFTPLEGLLMGTRSGSVDPGILTYLMRKDRCTSEQIDEILNTQSGLLGLSGVSSDMRRIVAAMQRGHSRAQLAFDVFIHRLRSGIGAMVAALGGLDALVFTAGIGENSAEVRGAACANFDYLGLRIDPAKNAAGAPAPDRDISTPDSPVHVLVIRAQEDWAIARDCWKLISGATAE